MPWARTYTGNSRVNNGGVRASTVLPMVRRQSIILEEAQVSDEPMIKFSVDGDGIGTLLLNRPHLFNAFNIEMADLWGDTIAKAAADDSVKVVVLAANGKAFCAGGDLDMVVEMQKADSLWHKNFLFEHVHNIARALERMDKPIIAAIHGAARGAGWDMALMCDMRCCTESATFGQSYILLGVTPGDGGTYYLPRLTNPSRALDLFWTGRAIDSREALSYGLVDRVFPDDALMENTYELARQIASRNPHAVRATKRLVYNGLGASLAANLDYISSTMAMMQATDEHRKMLVDHLAEVRRKSE